MSILSKITSFISKQLSRGQINVDLVHYRAHSVIDYYSKTYHYVFCIPWQCYGNEFWAMSRDVSCGAELLDAWCDEYCTGRRRRDFLRVSLRDNIPYGAHLSSDYVFDELGGGDVLFFAFEDIRDFCLFSLRWGYVAS